MHLQIVDFDYKNYNVKCGYCNCNNFLNGGPLPALWTIECKTYLILSKNRLDKFTVKKTSNIYKYCTNFNINQNQS